MLLIRLNLESSVMIQFGLDCVQIEMFVEMYVSDLMACKVTFLG